MMWRGRGCAWVGSGLGGGSWFFSMGVVLVFVLGSVLVVEGARGRKPIEAGFTLGAANALTDLGGANDIGSPGIRDLELVATRPALGILARYTFNPYTSLRVQLSWAMLTGDDDWLNPNVPGGHLPRYYRNLDFKTHIIELAFLGEWNLVRYEPNRPFRYRHAPYLMTGFVLFWFDPRAIDGTRLKPLRTEGQGLPEYPSRKPYASIQPAIPIGLGYKYNFSKNWTIAFEIILKYTFTDYLDDVSKTFPDPKYYYAHYPAAQARLMDQYSNRWRERCQQGECLVFGPGDQRGDPTDNDHYGFIGMITLTYVVRKGQLYCPKFR